MKCCEMWGRRKLKIYKPSLLPSTEELRSREVVRIWRPLRTHKMRKKQYENTFTNWLTQRQSFLSDKNESIRANEEEEEEEEGQQKRPTFRHQSQTLINETPKLRHWLAARNVGSRDPSGNFLLQPRPQGLLACRRHIGKREDPGDEVASFYFRVPKTPCFQNEAN